MTRSSRVEATHTSVKVGVKRESPPLSIGLRFAGKKVSITGIKWVISRSQTVAQVLCVAPGVLLWIVNVVKIVSQYGYSSRDRDKMTDRK